MEFKDLFDLNINSSQLYGADKSVIKGEHGVSKNEHNEHFATHFHIKSKIAIGSMRTFFNEQFPTAKDLHNVFVKDGHDPNELPLVQYLGENYTLKKYKLEWIAKLYLKSEPKSRDSQIAVSDLNSLSINVHVIAKFEEVIKNQPSFYTQNEQEFISNILHLLRNNPDQFEILVQAYFQAILETTFRKVYDSNSSFQSEFHSWLKQKGYYKEYNSNCSYNIRNILDYCLNRNLVTIDVKKYLDNLTRFRNNLMHQEPSIRKDFTSNLAMATKTVELIGELTNI